MNDDIDDKRLVPVYRKHINDTTRIAYFQRKKDNTIERLIPPSLEACTLEIEFCHRYITGGISPTANLRMYGLESAGKGDSEKAEERAVRLLPIYDEWKKDLLRTTPVALSAVVAAVLEGVSLNQIKVRNSLSSIAVAGNAVLLGLNRLRKFYSVAGERCWF